MYTDEQRNVPNTEAADAIMQMRAYITERCGCVLLAAVVTTSFSLGWLHHDQGVNGIDIFRSDSYLIQVLNIHNFLRMLNINAYNFRYQIEIQFNHYLLYIQSDMLEKKNWWAFKSKDYTLYKDKKKIIVIYESST